MAGPDEQHHIALPKLYGAPAYARPPRSVETAERPLDPDDLPLEVEQTDEERALAEAISQPQRSVATQATQGSHLRPRPLGLRDLGRILGGSN